MTITTTRSVWGEHGEIVGFNLHDAKTYEVHGKVGLRIVEVAGEPMWEVVWRPENGGEEYSIGAACLRRVLEK